MRVSDYEYEQLRIESEKQGVSMSDLVRKSIFLATETRNTESRINPAVSFHPLSEAQMCPPESGTSSRAFSIFLVSKSTEKSQGSISVRMQ